MENNIIKIDNFDIKALAVDTRTKLIAMASEVHKKPEKELTPEDISDVISLHLNTHDKTLSVYCQSTRQVEQFNPNSYSATQVIDLENAFLFIKARVEEQKTAENKIEKYIELRSLFYKLIHFKFHATEDFLRTLLREAEIKDEARGVGRFAK